MATFDLELFRQYKDEQDPKKKGRLEARIIQENLPFVKQQAQKYLKRTTVQSDLEDLVQAGAIGMLVALRKFDPSKAAFTTYTGWWILHEMQCVTAKTQPVYRPKGAGMPYKLHRLAEAIEAETGKEATDADLEVSPGTVDAWRQAPVFFPLDNFEAGTTSDDKLADTSQLTAEDQMAAWEHEAAVCGAFGLLSDSERQLLEERFLEGKPIQDVAHKMAIARAAKKLRQAFKE